MAQFIGEYECKLDNKGRIALPSKLKTQIPESAGGVMVLSRGFENCLVLMTKDDWLFENKKLQKLSTYNRKVRLLLRNLNKGVSPVHIDNSSRILISKGLVDFAGLNEAVILTTYSNRIEIWDKAKYEAEISIEEDDLSKLAEEYLGANTEDED